MKAIQNFENVQAKSGDYNRLVPGGYIVEILSVKDVPLDTVTGKGDYLIIDYDIAEGEFANYYTERHERFGGDWFANFIRSYKESAAGMFKHFINCVESSNIGYKWAWDEKSLVRKRVGVVLGEAEYIKGNGAVGVKMVVKSIKTVAQIENGDFIVPAIKKVSQDASAVNAPNMVEIDLDSDLPF